MSKLKKNLGLQTIYQIIVTITPLITSPYVSRILTAKGLGIYSYTYSVVNCFILFAMLGVINYGSRTIAMASNEKEENKLFCEIYCMQLLFSGIASLMYIMFMFFCIKENNIIAYIQAFWIISCMFDVTWYFFGKEQFKITVMRNLIIKVLTIASIFIFVRNANDLWKYTFIMAFGTLFSQVILWSALWKNIKFHFVKFERIIFHLKPTVILFVPILAMSICHIMDKTMLGHLSNYEQSGFYYNTDKLINIPLGIITGTGTVMLPKMSSLRAKGKFEESKKIINLSINVFLCIAVAMAFGMSAVAKEFVPFFFGKGYEACIKLIFVLSSVIIFKSISNALRNQYMIPFNKEKYFIISVIVGAFVNFILNIIFIKYLNLGALGATIGTLVAEGFVCILQVIMVENELDIIKVIFKSSYYILIGIIMFIVVRLVSFIEAKQFIKILLEIISGVAIYGGLCLLYWRITNNEMMQVLKISVSKENK